MYVCVCISISSKLLAGTDILDVPHLTFLHLSCTEEILKTAAPVQVTLDDNNSWNSSIPKVLKNHHLLNNLTANSETTVDWTGTSPSAFNNINLNLSKLKPKLGKTIWVGYLQMSLSTASLFRFDFKRILEWAWTFLSWTRACQYLEQHIPEHNLCFISRISHRMNQRATNSGSKIVQLFNLIKLQPLVTDDWDWHGWLWSPTLGSHEPQNIVNVNIIYKQRYPAAKAHWACLHDNLWYFFPCTVSWEILYIHLYICSKEQIEQLEKR